MDGRPDPRQSKYSWAIGKQLIEQIVRCVLVMGRSGMGCIHIVNVVCRFINIAIRCKQLLLLNIHSWMLSLFSLNLLVSLPYFLRITFLADKITNHVSAQTELWLENLKERTWCRWKENIKMYLKGLIHSQFLTQFWAVRAVNNWARIGPCQREYGVDSFCSRWGPVVGCRENDDETRFYERIIIMWRPIGFSRRIVL